MIRSRIVVIAIVVLTLSVVGFAAQNRVAKKKKAAAPAAPPLPTLQSCGASLRLPPGWQLMRAAEYEKAHPEVAPDEPSKSPNEPADTQPAQQSAEPQPATPQSQSAESQPATPATQPAEPQSSTQTSQQETPKPTEAAPPSTPPAPKPENPCRFVITSKYPSELVRNTDADGPVGRMEIEIVNADLETAAAQLMEKDEKGWYVNGPNGTRYDARLSKPRRGLQTLTAVIVEACHDLNGKYRSLCESDRYVYSNGHRSALISAGPYLGETEASLLTSLRFAPIATKSRTRSRQR